MSPAVIWSSISVYLHYSGAREEKGTEIYHIRRAAVDYGVSLLTNEKYFKLFVDTLERVKSFQLKTWKEYLNMTTFEDMPTSVAGISPMPRFPTSPEMASQLSPLSI